MVGSRKKEGERENTAQLTMELSGDAGSQLEADVNSMFDEAWMMFQEGGHRLIISIIEGERPLGITEKSVILARMAQQMENGSLYQHRGVWTYKGD